MYICVSLSLSIHIYIYIYIYIYVYTYHINKRQTTKIHHTVAYASSLFKQQRTGTTRSQASARPPRPCGPAAVSSALLLLLSLL